MPDDKPVLRICETCPWLLKNHGKRHPAGWYTKTNLRRLWNGLRSGKAPGMLCHSSDPNAPDYGGKEGIKPGHEQHCTGALLLMYANMNAIAEGKPQPFHPELKRRAIAMLVEKHLMGQTHSLDNRLDEVGLPWQIR